MALVITIILLLILTSVSLKVYIDNKLTDRALNTVSKANTTVSHLQKEMNQLLSEWSILENGIFGGTNNGTTGGNTSGNGNTTGGNGNTSGGDNTTTPPVTPTAP